MIINDLPLDNPGPRRVPFSQASSLLVSQAIAYANERLVLHFPTLGWSTWSATLLQLQPDLLVNGKEVSLDWQDLTHLVQLLNASLELPALDPPVYGSEATELAEQLITYHQQIVRALAQQQENPQAYDRLVQELVMALAKSNAVAERVHAATRGVGQRPPNLPSPQAVEKPLPLPVTAGGAVDSLGKRDEVPGLSAKSPVPPQKDTSEQASNQRVPARRTFRDIVQHHQRSNGKTGFTVRELCTTMRICAASLTEARDNPGRLSLNAVVALARAMEESPLQVIADLLAETGAKKERRRRRATRSQRPKNDPLDDLG